GIFTTFALLIIALQKPGEDLIPILSTKLVVSLTAIAASSVFAQEIRQGNDRFEKARRKLVEAVSLVYNVRYVTQGANERRQAINPPSPEPNPAVVPDKVEPPLQAPPEAYHLNKFISSLHNLQTLFGSNVKRLDQFVSAFKPLSDSVAALNEHFSGTNATLSNAVDKQLPELAAQIKNLAETLERRAGDPFMNGRETPVEPLDERRNEV
ncbi:MAG: hypothetical protein KAH44_27365, partial [Oricola sp.]|nr:hypothetical protein [Oricola sp.]